MSSPDDGSEFLEVDWRLSLMHGYEPVMTPERAALLAGMGVCHESLRRVHGARWQ